MRLPSLGLISLYILAIAYVEVSISTNLNDPYLFPYGCKLICFSNISTIAVFCPHINNENSRYTLR